MTLGTVLILGTLITDLKSVVLLLNVSGKERISPNQNRESRRENGFTELKIKTGVQRTGEDGLTA